MVGSTIYVRITLVPFSHKIQGTLCKKGEIESFEVPHSSLEAANYEAFVRVESFFKLFPKLILIKFNFGAILDHKIDQSPLNVLAMRLQNCPSAVVPK